jgi:RNA polymerase sigma-70 factor (ECF subfamily)
MPVMTPVRKTGPAKLPPRPKRHTDDPEVRLMLRVQHDDAGAFGELIERYWSRVFGHFFRRLGDRQEAEDLAQDVFLRLYRYRKRYQPRAKFTTWLFHITQNVVRNAVRSRRRHPTVRLPWLPAAGEEGNYEPAGHVAARNEPPSWPLERAELATVVRAAVSTLGTRQRRALELHQFEDCTYAEVAAEMHMSPKAAKSLLYRARNQLRVSLSGFVTSGATAQSGETLASRGR